jgi:hypothetical protein
MLTTPVNLNPPAALRAPAVAADASLARDFEAMVLAPMVETMLPEAGAFFGEGAGAAIWRAQLATVIADAMAERGGIGISDAVFDTRPNASTMAEASR